MVLDIHFKTPLSAIDSAPLVFQPLLAAPHAREPKDQFVQPEVEPEPKKEKEEPSEYRWVVDVAGVAGALVGGILFGVPGIIIGGALLATAGVPLRRWLASNENPKVLENDLSLEGEMAVTAGSSLLFGLLFMGAAGLARFVGTRLGTAIATRVASAAARRPLIQKAGEKIWEPFKGWYVGKGHLVLRSGAALVASYDLLHDKEGRFDLSNGSLDTGWGFAATLYSGNLVYERVFGANPFGVDAATPLSFVAYQLFRTLAGADPLDFSDFNYNEAIRFRYIAEFGNTLQSTATYGRAYLRPDLRDAIARSKGLWASKKTGSTQLSLFGLTVDKTLGALYRHRRFPNRVRTVIRPTVHYPEGPLFKPSDENVWKAGLAERLTIIKGFKENDMMKPIYGESGRLLSLTQQWGLIVPWWLVGAPAVGMSRGEWGPNRYWKFTAWSLMGTPIKAGLGSDTVAAQAAGFGLGMIQDAVITEFYNPRYKKRHWAGDLHESLARFRAEPHNQDQIAEDIYDDIFCRQMTDWSLSQFIQGNGFYRFNPGYLGTWGAELAVSTPEDLETLSAVHQNRIRAAAVEKFDKRQINGLPLFAQYNHGDPRR